MTSSCFRAALADGVWAEVRLKPDTTYHAPVTITSAHNVLRIESSGLSLSSRGTDYVTSAFRGVAGDARQVRALRGRQAGPEIANLGDARRHGLNRESVPSHPL